MKTIKSIDGKSLLIGGLLVAVMLIGVASKEAPEKAAQKYEYGYLKELRYAITEGDKVFGGEGHTGLPEVDAEGNFYNGPWILTAPRFNEVAKEGWEPCPSGHQFRLGKNQVGVPVYFKLMRRPIK